MTFILKKSLTERGFALIEFSDLYDVDCSLQKSSLATKDAIWFGCNTKRMHLSQEQVKELLPILQHFVKTGDLPVKKRTNHESASCGC